MREQALLLAESLFDDDQIAARRHQRVRAPTSMKAWSASWRRASRTASIGRLSSSRRAARRTRHTNSRDPAGRSPASICATHWTWWPNAIRACCCASAATRWRRAARSPGIGFETFERALAQVALEWLDAASLTRRLDTDGPLAPEYMRVDLVDTLHREVWGQGFAPPTFSEEVEVISQRLVGEKHLALKLRHQGKTLVDGIWFGHTEPLPARVVHRVPARRRRMAGRAAGSFSCGRGRRMTAPGTDAPALADPRGRHRDHVPRRRGRAPKSS